MNYSEIYQAKLGTLEGALDLIQSGDTIATPIYGNEPTQFLKQLHTIAPRVTDVSLIHDGDCIQLGIGGMPNAVGEAPMDKQELNIHTEMITLPWSPWSPRIWPPVWPSWGWQARWAPPSPADCAAPS